MLWNAARAFPDVAEAELINDWQKRHYFTTESQNTHNSYFIEVTAEVDSTRKTAGAVRLTGDSQNLSSSRAFGKIALPVTSQ
jgi:hypothetical protein